MLKTMILGIVRHILTTAGGGIIANGWLSSDDYMSAAGALITLIGAVWSVIEKKRG